MLIIRDFNLHHINWNDHIVNSILKTKKSINWIINKNARYKLKVNIVMYA